VAIGMPVLEPHPHRDLNCELTSGESGNELFDLGHKHNSGFARSVDPYERIVDAWKVTYLMSMIAVESALANCWVALLESL
jgi:hypothetical protein